MKRHLLALTALAIVTGAVSCSNNSVIIKRPQGRQLNADITHMWGREVRRVAQTGDWILTRSYSFTGDVITTGTRGESLSHASVYDARTGTIIEALTPRVREVPLDSLLERNQKVIIVRPHGLDTRQRIAAADRARSKVGTRFDYGGLVGLGADDKFYCSELVYWSAGLDPDDQPLVVSPADLMKYGEVIYYSGERDDPQIQDAARVSAKLLRARAMENQTRTAAVR